MKNLVIISHSGYGHTRKVAEAVAEGAAQAAGVAVEQIFIDAEGVLTDDQWSSLNTAHGIVFGTPTYMGGPSWQFKRFADASSRPWFGQKWKDKLAAGFTNSATINGDKGSTISYLITLAMQHGMIWVGTGLLPSNSMAATRNDINWLGGFSGLLAQSPSDASPEQGPLPGDLETAKIFGKRVAEALGKWGQ